MCGFLLWQIKETLKLTLLLKQHDGKVFMSCHKNIMKKRTPCQAVSNKSDVKVVPKDLQNLGKLEKLLISKRILFKSCNNA